MPTQCCHGAARAHCAFGNLAGDGLSLKLTEIAEYGDVRTPGRHLGTQMLEDDEAFADNKQKLLDTLVDEMATGAQQDQIKRKKMTCLAMSFED